MNQPITNSFVSVEDMDREDIKAALRKRGLSLRALSVSNGLAPSTLVNALSIPYPKGETIIANALELSVEDIWPTRVAKRKLKEDVQKRLSGES